MRTRALQARARAAFTLVELMIALVVAGLVISTMYAMSAASTRHFQVQHQVANMQSALRFAYIQVKRDVMRAGYLATPRDTLDQCGPGLLSGNIDLGGLGWIAGISSFRNDVAPNVVDPTGNNGGLGFTHDELTMVGNYTTSNEYPGVRVVNASQIVLDVDPTTTWHSIQSDFGWNSVTQVAQPAVDPVLVANVFPRNGLIRIRTTTNQRHYAKLTAPATVVGLTIQLSFSPALPVSCQAIANEGWVAPLNVIRYGAAWSGGVQDGDRITGAIPQLVRTEIEASTANQLMPNTPTVVILDYLAAFNLRFTMNAPGAGVGIVDTYQAQIGQPTNNQVAVNQNPELVRAIQVELAVRGPSIDPGVVWPPPAAFPLTYIQLDAAAPTRGARVRVLRSEIFVPNIAYEGY